MMSHRHRVLFGQVRYKIIPQVELEAGARWTDETRTNAGYSNPETGPQPSWSGRCRRSIRKTKTAVVTGGGSRIGRACSLHPVIFTAHRVSPFDAAGQFPQKAYETLGLRLEWTDPSDKLTLALYGDNFTNSHYLVQVLPSTFGIGGTSASRLRWGAP